MGGPNGGWRCQYGSWHDLYEECTCSPAAVLAVAFGGPGKRRPDLDAAGALPDPTIPGTTVRYHVDEHLVPCLRAVLTHPAVTVVRRPRFAKELAA